MQPKKQGTIRIQSDYGLPAIDIYFEEFYDDNPEGKPVLVFLHGGPGIVDHQIYVPFWSQLSTEMRVVFFDMRGHGQSGGHDVLFKPTWNLAYWAKDVHSVCVALGIEKPIVVGFSMGGWVALDYALQFPHHMEKLILCNTEAYVEVEERANAYARKALQRGSSKQEAEKVKQIIFALRDKAGDPKTSEDYVQYCMPLFSEHPYTTAELALCKKKNLALWQHFDLNEYYSLNYLPKLQSITTECLCIAGENDPEHPPLGARKLAAGLANVQLVVIPKTGDPVWRDTPQPVIDILKSFILDRDFPDYIPIANHFLGVL